MKKYVIVMSSLFVCSALLSMEQANPGLRQRWKDVPVVVRRKTESSSPCKKAWIAVKNVCTSPYYVFKGLISSSPYDNYEEKNEQIIALAKERNESMQNASRLKRFFLSYWMLVDIGRIRESNLSNE